MDSGGLATALYLFSTMTSILVTGAAGAVGTALCRRLADTDHEVVGIDTDEPQFETGVPVEQVDLTAEPTLPAADVIVHLAAHARVPPVVDEPSKAFTNVATTEPVLEHARQTDASVVFASSREVYGDAIRPTEDDATLDSPNPYAGSKAACEALCNSYHNCYAVETTVVRLSNVYGPWDTNSRVVPIFVALADAGEELTVFGEGKLLDFLYVEDAVAALLSVIERRSALAGETLNLGSGRGQPLTTLAEIVASEIEDCPGYTVEQDRAGEVGRYVADISTATATLGWEPETEFEDGVDKAVEWYRERPRVLERIRSDIGAT
jgi:nucleoside-diphosphate-sugar epimerase